MTLPVKYFDSTMQGAPQLTNAWGCMTALLDAVLVTGFNLKSVSEITQSANIATASIAAGHLFQVGQVVLIAGANQAEYNGEFKVLSVTGTTFTFSVAGSPVTPATGTMTCKAAPLGFEIAFTGTNKRAYRTPNVLSNRPFLRVDDGLDPSYTTTYAKYAKVTVAQGMSDIDTFVGARAPYDAAFPSRNEVGTGSATTGFNGWYKWIYAMGASSYMATIPTESVRDWVLIGDDRGFYLFNTIEAGNLLTTHTQRTGYCFSDFDSFRSVDGFNTLLAAHDFYYASNMSVLNYSTPGGFNDFPTSSAYTGKILMRSHLQIGGNVRTRFCSLGTLSSPMVSGRVTGVPWPNGPDYSLLLHPVYLHQEDTHLRGKLPGMMFVHNNSPLFDKSRVTGVAGYPGREFILVDVTDSSLRCCVAFDLTGPWR
jgi:hypothetical protein